MQTQLEIPRHSLPGYIIGDTVRAAKIETFVPNTEFIDRRMPTQLIELFTIVSSTETSFILHSAARYRLYP